MSTDLWWRPVPKKPEPTTLPFALKKALAQRYWGHDGSVCGDAVELGGKDLSYLDGLRDAGLDGADELIAAIKAHGEVEVWIR